MTLILLDHLIIIADQIDLVKVDSEKKVTLESQFKFFQPKTWFLPAIKNEETKLFFQIFYVRDKQSRTFTYYCKDYNSIVQNMTKIAEQLKLQSNVQNQEMLDKLFEDALRKSK